jgi:acetyl-CoA carboxylase biotin carboxyl carrier protein
VRKNIKKIDQRFLMKLQEKEEDIIRKLSELLTETGLTEIEIETKGQKFRVARTVTVAAAPLNTNQPIEKTATAAPESTDSGPDMSNAIMSPMVGTTYTAAKPGAAPYVSIGDQVNEGDTLLIIEAMKVMNPIPAPKSGKITKIFVDDASPVEFGQPLMVIE